MAGLVAPLEDRILMTYRLAAAFPPRYDPSCPIEIACRTELIQEWYGDLSAVYCLSSGAKDRVLACR